MSGYVVSFFTCGGICLLIGLIVGWHAHHHHQLHKMRMHAMKVAMPHMKNLAYTYLAMFTLLGIGVLVVISKWRS